VTFLEIPGKNKKEQNGFLRNNNHAKIKTEISGLQ
jgi:hypothetical protein